MPRANQALDPDNDSEALAELARRLRLTVTPEDLTALAQQLQVIDELEEKALQDTAPILRMDADWHD